MFTQACQTDRSVVQRLPLWLRLLRLLRLWLLPLVRRKLCRRSARVCNWKELGLAGQQEWVWASAANPSGLSGRHVNGEGSWAILCTLGWFWDAVQTKHCPPREWHCNGYKSGRHRSLTELRMWQQKGINRAGIFGPESGVQIGGQIFQPERHQAPRSNLNCYLFPPLALSIENSKPKRPTSNQFVCKWTCSDLCPRTLEPTCKRRRLKKRSRIT